jgi:hypothetical protein
MANKEVKELLRLARRQGMTVEQTGGDHVKIINPETGGFHVMGTTPTLNGHGLANIKGDLRRHTGMITDPSELRRRERAQARDEALKRAAEVARGVEHPEVVTQISERVMRERVESSGFSRDQEPSKEGCEEMSEMAELPSSCELEAVDSTSPKRPVARKGQTESAVPCPVRGCHSSPARPNLNRHMRDQHPTWKYVKQGTTKIVKHTGEWISPSEFTRRRAGEAIRHHDAANELVTAMSSTRRRSSTTTGVDSTSHYVYVSNATDYKYTNQVVHTDQKCPVAAGRKAYNEQRLDLTPAVLDVVQWRECRTCVARRSMFGIELKLSTPDCDALAEIITAGGIALPEHADLANRLLNIVERRKPINEAVA